MSKITHIEIAVLNKINQLSEAYGLELWEFDCEYDGEKGEISFPSTPGGGQYLKFEKMLHALGCKNGRVQFDSDRELIGRLDEALRSVPRVWAR